MTVLAMYGAGLAAVSTGSTERWLLRYADGSASPLLLGRWCGSLSPGDGTLLSRCAGPTLDLGCGPGRLAAAAAWQGLPVLGVDVSSTAVRLTRERGVCAVRRSVFDRLPAEGRWQTALLADGNIGIGGDPARLLRRASSLLRPGGMVLAEVDAPEAVTRAVRVRIEAPSGECSTEFGWAHVSATDIDSVARAAGLSIVDRWQEAGRWFAALQR